MKRTASGDTDQVLVAMSFEAEMFLALAARISGAAVGWTPGSISLLREGIQHRFGHLLGPGHEHAAAELIELAMTPVST